MADPLAGRATLVVCHNDVCLENVVFHDGIAVALLDFDFAAPGRRVYDLSQFARMCVPIDDESRVRFGWRPADLEERLRLVADAYGLPPGRDELFDALADGIARGGEFLRGGSRPATTTSSRCGSRWAGWPASIDGARGSPPTPPGSATRSAERLTGRPC